MKHALAICLAVSLGFVADICTAQDQDHDVWLKLDSGNVELLADDGSEVHVSPGSDMTITHATGPGEVTHVNLKTGHLHVSNITHEHSDVMLVHTGTDVIEIERAAVMISHGEDGLHVVLRNGKGVGVRGHGLKITTPMTAFRKHRGPPVSIPMDHNGVRNLFNRFGGPGGPAGAGPKGILKKGDAGGETKFARAARDALPAVLASPLLSGRLTGAPGAKSLGGGRLHQHQRLFRQIDAALPPPPPPPPIRRHPVP